MKSLIKICAVLLLAVSITFSGFSSDANALIPTEEQVQQEVSSLFTNYISDENKQRIAENSLLYRHHNALWIFLQSPAKQEDRKLASEAKYWYRCMTEDEFKNLFAKNQVLLADSYVGIATNRQYALSYIKNKSLASHCVEFKTPDNGYLYDLFTTKNNIQIKAEGDGGTYGLGTRAQGGGKTGKLFNERLAKGDITWRLVDLRIQNKLPQ